VLSDLFVFEVFWMKSKVLSAVALNIIGSSAEARVLSSAETERAIKAMMISLFIFGISFMI
jgi:hypothetical protein